MTSVEETTIYKKKLKIAIDKCTSNCKKNI